MARPRTISDEDMLAAARAVFLEQGAGASTALIADRIGVSQAALFKRFGTKRDLMVAALAPPKVPTFLPHLETGPDPARPALEQLEEIGRYVLDFFRDMVPAIMVLSTCGFDPEELFAEHPVPPPLQAMMGMAGWIERAIDLGMLRGGEPVHLAMTFLGSLHIRAFFSAFTRTPMTDDDVDVHVTAAVDALWHGLAPSEETPS